MALFFIFISAPDGLASLAKRVSSESERGAPEGGSYSAGSCADSDFCTGKRLWFIGTSARRAFTERAERRPASAVPTKSAKILLIAFKPQRCGGWMKNPPYCIITGALNPFLCPSASAKDDEFISVGDLIALALSYSANSSRQIFSFAYDRVQRL